MKKEIFKQIPTIENYFVSNFGNIKSVSRNKILKPTIRKGYKCVTISKNGIKKTKSIHQLVAMAFLNHTPNGHKIVVDHINGTKTDNRLENLQLISNRENLHKAKRKKTSKHIGVWFRKDIGKWRTQIQIKGKNIGLGTHNCETKAMIIYQLNLLKHEKSL